MRMNNVLPFLIKKIHVHEIKVNFLEFEVVLIEFILLDSFDEVQIFPNTFLDIKIFEIHKLVLKCPILFTPYLTTQGNVEQFQNAG